ncbi:hypothetical protein E6W36_01590 [Hankyongella ginsenosidimutans]|uniref:Uncharacterized protein n=1 Tax=Hankyongella ginsenosidimutans TaxID=1763828 RepID=A0A4D7BT76_9SPHN|nr:hypothetical protein [Hankyongella ginsenosidimutans]QCI78789.1 hypothetical protein E6W36_01590 [Hankyongella ginsenosidimutans]TXH37464.1 MAG: hypothetical protein E6Q98_06620 [Rhodospirillaceae bacterium]
MMRWLDRLHWAWFGVVALAAWVAVNLTWDSMQGLALTRERTLQHMELGLVLGLAFAWLRRRKALKDAASVPPENDKAE